MSGGAMASSNEPSGTSAKWNHAATSEESTLDEAGPIDGGNAERGDRLNRSECPTQADLLALISDELASDRFDAVAGHVDSCLACQAELDELTASELADDENRIVDHGSSEQLQQLLSEMKQAGVPGDLSESHVETLPYDAAQSEQPVRFPGPPTDDAPLGTLGHYRVAEQIGKGANGFLFRAFDARLQREVAIKVLRGELASLGSARVRFEREGRTIAQLDDDHIVRVLDVGSPPDFPPYLVMELVRGESLADRIRRQGVHDPTEAASLLVAMLDGLEAAHRAGIVHRDVKPGNVLIDADNRVKLVDFGLARLDDHPVDLTANATVLGTPAYMSPEQILEPATVDGRSDVYSAGVVLFELLTGELPFRGVPRMVLHQVLNDEPRPLRRLNDSVPRDLETICLKALSRDIAKRYQSATEFADDLERWLHGMPIQARPIGMTEKMRLWRRRNPGVFGLLAAGGCLLMGLLAMWLCFTVSIARSRSGLAEANRLLTEARDRAAAGQQAAAENAKLAQLQANLAISLINEIVFDIQNELAGSPDTAAFRESVLQRAVTRLEELVSSTDAALTPRLSLIVARNRRAVALRELGRTEEALAELGVALRESEGLVAAEHDVLAALNCRALTQLNLGATLLAPDRQQGLRHFSKSAVDYRKLLEILPVDDPMAEQARQNLDLALQRLRESQESEVEQSTANSRPLDAR